MIIQIPEINIKTVNLSFSASFMHKTNAIVSIYATMEIIDK